MENMENPQRSVEEMVEDIRAFTLDGGVHGNQGYQRVILQLCGLIGNGKSMLVNSCKYVLEGGEYVMHASDEPTYLRKTYQLTPNITIADSRPMHVLDDRNIPTVYAQLGLSPIVIITHKNQGDAEEAERHFRLAGAEHVVLVENYTREDPMRTLGRDTAILTFLYIALQDVTFRMSERRNVIRERTERKKFLIKYMHQAVLEREIGNMRKSEMLQLLKMGKTAKCL